DIFNVTASLTATINIDGEPPVAPALPGDTLNFDAQSHGIVVGPAYLTFTGAKPVNYVSIETLSISNVNGPYEIDGSDVIDDVLILSKVAGHLQYVLNGAAPIIIDGATAFTFNGEGGNDTMIVDEIGGNPAPAGGATFIGGSNGAVG